MIPWPFKWLSAKVRPQYEIVMEKLMSGRNHEYRCIKVKNHCMYFLNAYSTWADDARPIMKFIPEVKTLLYFNNSLIVNFENLLSESFPLQKVFSKFSKDVFFFPTANYVSTTDDVRTIVESELSQFYSTLVRINLIDLYERQRDSYLRLMKHFDIPSLIDKYYHSRVFIPGAANINVQDLIPLLPGWCDQELSYPVYHKDLETYCLSSGLRAIFSYPNVVPRVESQFKYILGLLKNLVAEEHRLTEVLQKMIYVRSNLIGLLIAVGRIHPDVVWDAINAVNTEDWYRPQHCQIILELMRRLASLPIFQQKYDFSYKATSLMVKTLEVD